LLLRIFWPQIPHGIVPLSLGSFFFKGRSSFFSLIGDIINKPPRHRRALNKSRNIEIGMTPEAEQQSHVPQSKPAAQTTTPAKSMS
jgi:hypothetical protein